MSERKRYVFPTSEIPHLWAHSHESQGQARNQQGNLYFTGTTLYSYRDSYPIARIVTNKRGETCVLIRTDKYSVTTAKHISLASRATNHLTQFEVVIVGADSAADHATNLTDYQTRISELEVKTMRARSYAEMLKRELDALVIEANAYAKFFNSRKRFKLTDSATLSDLVKVQAAKAKVENQKREASRKRAEASAILEAQKDLAAWVDGTGQYFPHVIWETYLRIEGDELVTSRGARIPIDHARLGLAFVRRVVASGVEYRRNGHTFHLGVYAIDKVETDGTLTAGCHVIRYSEIERVAPMLDAIRGTCTLAGELPMIGGTNAN